MKGKVCFLAKTNLKYDGRILAELNCLATSFPEVELHILLLPDGEADLELPGKTKLHEIKVSTRKLRPESVFKFLTLIIYSIKQFFLLSKIKPDVIHIHDVFSISGALLYGSINKIKIIYDDHELFEKPKGIAKRFFFYIEEKIIKKADAVISANEFRSRIISSIFSLKGTTILENHTFHPHKPENDIEYILDQEKKDSKIILHQGRLLEGRGRSDIATIARQLPEDWKLYIVGENKKNFQKWLVEFEINDNGKILYEGFVPYSNLSDVWSKVDAAIIIYDPEKINNKYCAPNRLYFALSNKVPVLSNASNPVLASYNKKYEIGYSFEESEFNATSFFRNYHKYKENYESINESFLFMDSQCEKLRKLYERL